MNSKLNKALNTVTLLLVGIVVLAGCSKETPTIDNKGYTVLSDGKRIPIANLTVKTVNSSRIIAAKIESGNTSNVDTARFYGVEYSEVIERASFQIPDGATITPTPSSIEDSVLID